MKAMLIWSDGCSLHYNVFEDKDNETGFERAQEQMHKEYDEGMLAELKLILSSEPVKLQPFAIM